MRECDGINSLDTDHCWSYTEKSDIVQGSDDIWIILVILQCILIKIIPAICIITMNIIIIVKVGIALLQLFSPEAFANIVAFTCKDIIKSIF